jgi:pyridinium-3,5-biscarboxylic acid mononucleotide sulfurtransferase
MNDKLKRLKELIKSYESMIVGFSGGVDSTLLCYLGFELLNDQFLAITAKSETLTLEDLQEAKTIATKYSWPHMIIQSNELNNEKFIANTPNRCAICKEIRFKNIIEFARKNGFNVVASGDNLDDMKDYRPGLQKIRELGVKSPLLEAGFTKEEIRILAKELGLPNHDKPSNPCLATRLPYGTSITPESLNMISKAEKFIK